MPDIDDLNVIRLQLLNYVNNIPPGVPEPGITLTFRQARALLAVIRDHEQRITALENAP